MQPEIPTSAAGASKTTSSFTAAQISILPYTHGLTGVDLWFNDITSAALYSSLGLIIILVLLSRVVHVTQAHLRLLATLGRNGEQQKYWTYVGSFAAQVKKHLLTAPLIRKRHNRELQLSSAVGIGTIPSRLHTIFIVFYLASNIIYCCVLDYWTQSKAAVVAEARGRTGHLAVMNMLPMFIFAARNNPFIQLLGISFDTFNLFHRWIGRLVVIESLAHTFLWGVNNYDARGLDGLTHHLTNDTFLIYGLISIIAMTLIAIQSISFIRHAFYEVFLHLHQILGAATMIGIVLHCEIQNLPQRPFLYVLISLWGLERCIRLLRIFYRRGTTVQVAALDGGACRLTFNIRGTWTKAPGHHVYIYLPAVSLWMSHPFSVAWVDSGNNPHCDNRPILDTYYSTDSESDFKPLPRRKQTTISCVVAARTGMTAALYRKASKSSNGVINLRAMVEGPYGGLESMRSYGTVVLFAGGVGITHQLSHVHDLVRAFSEGTCATRKVVLIWSVRSAEQLLWVKPWLDELTNMPRHGCTLKFVYFVTRRGPRDTDTNTSGSFKETGSSEHIEEHITYGRLNAPVLVLKEFGERVGAMGVGVCGPGALADDVRAATRTVMELGNVDFWEEAFTW